MNESLFVGLMSGTSADGVEAALVAFDGHGPAFRRARYHAFDPPLQAEINALARSDYAGRDALELLGALDGRLGEAFADVVLELLADADVNPARITAIGSHGQTVRHRPAADTRFTMQIGDPNIIAARTGITTVADFRRRDVALGGQGAPLATAFHQAVFAADAAPRAVLNLGGIANVSLLLPTGDVRGFDTGPANTLLNAWAARHGRGSFDEDGAFARAGQPLESLLHALLADAYFQRPPPKSSGPEYFNLDWLDKALAKLARPPAPEDVQATLIELTALSVRDALRAHAGDADQVYVCGGGVHNPVLMGALHQALPEVAVASTAALDVDPDYVEAMAFAWLAHQTLAGKAGNLPAVTGAREPAVLGAIYPGSRYLTSS